MVLEHYSSTVSLLTSLLCNNSHTKGRGGWVLFATQLAPLADAALRGLLSLADFKLQSLNRSRRIRSPVHRAEAKGREYRRPLSGSGAQGSPLI